MKNVLVIAYYFPPLGGGGVHRTLKFVKYLPTFGWRPIVLTAHPPRGVFEPALAAEIPATAEVRRSRYLEPGHLADAVRLLKSGDSRAVTVAPTPARRQGFGPDTEAQTRLSPLRRMLENLLVPDRQVSWALSGRRAAVRLIREFDVDAIYSSYNPGTAHLIAGLSKRSTGVPWLADFRDPWLRSPVASDWSSWQRLVARRFERWTLEHCNHVTAVSEAIIRDMRDDHQRIELPAATVLPNGFDPDDFAKAMRCERKRFTMTYAGTLYPDRDPAPFLDAVRLLLEREEVAPHEIEVRFVGSLAPVFQGRIQTGDLNGVITVTGQVGHAEAVDELCSAHLLWMTIVPAPSSAGILSLKVFEYLASGRPIVYVGPESAASRVLESAPGTEIMDYGDVEGIAAAILARIRLFRIEGAQYFERTAHASQWTRRGLTEKLAQILDEIASP